MNATTSRRGALPLGLGLALLAGCGGGDGGGDSGGGGRVGSTCSVDAEKNFVLNTARDWYLFLDLLPASVNAAAYATADELLDALTANARAENRDRFFSFLTSIAEEDAFFSQAQNVGFGFSFRRPGADARLFLTQVFETSAAANANFLRGDEILAIGTSSATLQPVPTLVATPDGLTNALGPSEAGVTRTFRVRTQDDATVERTMTKSTYTLDPVRPDLLLPRAGLTPVGYVNLRTFVSPADAQLRAAFGRFRAADVRDVIVDLRYNGGGLVATAEILANLLAAGLTNQVMLRTRFNTRHPEREETVRFRAETNAVAALRIAFIATDASASASEIVINALAPYADVAIVGSRTFGKPVGQFGFDLAGCDTRLRLVTFLTENATGNGDYYDGLPNPGFTDAFCSSTDDVTRPQGDAGERMTRDALAWITDNACPVTATLADDSRRAPEIRLVPRDATPGQVHIPGSF